MLFTYFKVKVAMAKVRIESMNNLKLEVCSVEQNMPPQPSIEGCTCLSCSSFCLAIILGMLNILFTIKILLKFWLQSTQIIGYWEETINKNKENNFAGNRLRPYLLIKESLNFETYLDKIKMLNLDKV